MSKIILKGFIIVPDSDLEMVKAELINHTKLTLKELGCITFKVNQNQCNQNRFDVYEEFIDQASFENHQERVKTSYWGKVSVNAERHYEIMSVSA